MTRRQRTGGGDSLRINRTIRFTVDENLKLERASRKAHMTVSDYVRLKLGLLPNYWWRKS